MKKIYTLDEFMDIGITDNNFSFLNEQDTSKLKAAYEDKAKRAIERSKLKAIEIKQKADIEAAKEIEKGQQNAKMIREAGAKRIEAIKNK
jgi:hypothetical protein